MLIIMLFGVSAAQATSVAAKDCDSLPQTEQANDLAGECEFGGEVVCQVEDRVLTCELDWTNASVSPVSGYMAVFSQGEQELRIKGYAGFAAFLSLDYYCCVVDREVASEGLSEVIINGSDMHETISLHVDNWPGPDFDLEPWTASETLYVTVNGGAGDDTLIGSHYSSNDPALKHTLSGESDEDLIYGAPKQASNLLGGPENDVIIGGNAGDYIDGGDHDDFVMAGNGPDLIYGWWGADLIDSGGGDDVIHGEGHQDWLHGGPDDDLIYGGGDHDVLYGGRGSDQLYGGAADDILCDTAFPTTPGDASTCPAYFQLVGGPGFDRAWIRGYSYAGDPSFCEPNVDGNNTVEEARNISWDWLQATSSVPELETAPYQECQDLIELFR